MRSSGYYWRPAALIERLAAANASFEQWDREAACDRRAGDNIFSENPS